MIRKRNIWRGAIFFISSLAKQNLIKIVPAEKSEGCREEKMGTFAYFLCLVPVHLAIECGHQNHIVPESGELYPEGNLGVMVQGPIL